MLFGESAAMAAVGLVVVGVLVVLNVALFVLFFSTWIQAYLSGVPIWKTGWQTCWSGRRKRS